MSLSESVIQLQCLRYCLLRFRESVIPVHEIVVCCNIVGVSQSRVRLRVVRIDLNCLLEEFQGSQDSFLASLAPEEPSFEVESICFHVLSLLPTRFLNGDELDLQGLCDLPCYVILNLEDVVQLSVVFLGPQVSIFSDIDELHCDAQSIS